MYGKRFRSSAFFMSNRVTVKTPEKALLEFVNKCNLKQDRLIFLALEDVWVMSEIVVLGLYS